MDQTESLQDDALADILRRLKPCELAAARCVRKTWRAVVDAHGLLLPHSMHGIFLNYVDHQRPHCFSRPSAAQEPVISGDLSFLPGYTDGYNPIIDHCNGLLLYEDFPKHYVVNPATKRWDCLRCNGDINRNAYLVFDPAISPHYEVFFIPTVPVKMVKPVPEDPRDSMEWPPSSWMLSVFSSKSWQWQTRSFVREGEAVGTVKSARADSSKPDPICCYKGPRRRYSVYCGGSLYVHCQGAFVARFYLSGGKYQVIKVPKYIGESKHAQYLGKSTNGVYLVTVHDGYRIRVCNLVESNGQIEWVLKHYVHLEPWTPLWLGDLTGFDKTWTLDDGDGYYKDGNDEGLGEGEVQKEKKEDKGGGENDGVQMVDNFEWNSDDENVLNIEDGYAECDGNVYFLGFHPYKEVIFLCLPWLYRSGLSFEKLESLVSWQNAPKILLPCSYQWNLRSISIHAMHDQGASKSRFKESS